ncbi:MAE_28990/MAE_18760 family HEPN-like nuclease [Yersinia mollaretii]|uniref:MAE_28990/MAE_18760 family HEPN-like nuclease n=1 Tax=Yersinia mollaretii TaxID=33060 RepID=UPI00067AE4FF|nr:MAE_28990/MAE_18760 family HEPN-like nuclease [Yersinia mollaretii]
MSLINVRDEYNERENDMFNIISLINSLEEERLRLQSEESNQDHDLIEKRINILKSALHLMSYNLVESVARGCIEGIYDHISDNNVNYSSLKEKIQINILDRCIKDNENGKAFFSKVGGEISDKIIQASLNLRKEFNGNVSKEVINKISKAYDITLTNSPECRNGIDLDTLKDIRNELAHGVTSFSNKGRNDSIEEVIRRINHINQYLLLIITCTEEYITRNGYLSIQRV